VKTTQLAGMETGSHCLLVSNAWGCNGVGSGGMVGILETQLLKMVISASGIPMGEGIRV
jgi:hypothetical protein